MSSFPNITHNLNKIAYQRVLLQDTRSFLGTRAICLVHTLATPLKAFSGLGRLASTILTTARIILDVFTLNAHPKQLLKATAYVIDVVGGALLLPIVLLANVIRGVVGTTLYPAAMIEQTTLEQDNLIDTEQNEVANLSSEEKRKRDILIYLVRHPLLNDTFVNYLI